MDEQENSSPSEEVRGEREEIVRALLLKLGEIIMSRPDGDTRKITSNYIASRWVGIWKLVNPDAPSLREYARILGMSASSLSQLATRSGEELEIRAPWQRIELREKYRRRALGVHAGTWHCTDETERKKIRKAQKDKRTAAEAVSPLKVTETAA